jgi:predicted nucleotidyltransferase
VLTASEIVALLRDAVPGLVAVYRYGSWGTLHERPDSDLDLAVLGGALLGATHCWELAQSLAVRVGRDVDLVDLRSVSTVLRLQVINEGERIFCADAAECDAFETYVMSSYARLNEERRGILQDVRERGTIRG